MLKVNAGGVNIAYEIAGSGPPIVLVHGYSSSLHGNWRRPGWIELLTQHGRQVIGLDCRGHGRSDKPHDSASYSGTRMADDILAVMDAAGIGRADLMGYSMGGGIVLDLLARHAERCHTVIMGGSGLPGPIAESLRRRFVAGRAAERTDQADDGRFRLLRLRANDQEALAAVAKRDRQHPDEAVLRSVQVPLLLVTGDQDPAIVPATRLAALVPGAELVILAGATHMSAVGDQRYKDAVVKFLERRSPLPLGEVAGS